MTDSRRITRALIAEKPWGEEFLREMDLVIAVNTIESLRTGRTLYNVSLNERVAECCHMLDAELEFTRLDTVRIPPNDEAPYKREEEAAAFLKELPRGHWAVFELDGMYDAYMADGFGGYRITANGHNFTKLSPEAHGLDPMALYASVLSYVIYIRRNEIQNEIMAHAYAKAGVEVGQVYSDIRINSKDYGKVEVTEIRPGHYPGNGDAVVVKATRRGVKPASFIMPGDSFASKIGAEHVMPPQYEDIDNHARLIEEFVRPLGDRPRTAATSSM